VLVKRTATRSVLYRRWQEQEQAEGNKPCSHQFFYNVYDRIDGVKFSDKVNLECGCACCVQMILQGWEEFTVVVKGVCGLLPSHGIKTAQACALENSLLNRLQTVSQVPARLLLQARGRSDSGWQRALRRALLYVRAVASNQQ
jgi:hypothetical protein